MIGQNMVSELYDCEVYDTSGEKIGSVKHVWVDDQTGAPMWASVHTGLFGMKESFIPLQSAELREHEVRVPIDKEQVKDSPKVDASHDRISDDDQAELLRYYGFGPQRTSPEGTSGQTGRHAAGQQTGQRGGQQTGQRGGQQAGMRAGQQTGQQTGRQTGQRTGQQAGTRAGRQTSQRAAAAGGRSDLGDSGREAMTRSEERLRIDTERVETGKVRLVKHVVTEEQQVKVPVSHEEVRVVREPITAENRDAALSGAEITDAEHEVTLHADKPVVRKETVPVEQVRLDMEEVADTETVSGQVRKEVIDVEDDRRNRRER